MFEAKGRGGERTGEVGEGDGEMGMGMELDSEDMDIAGEGGGWREG